MSESEPKLPIAKAYWALMALSFIALLLGTAPDENDKYKTALKELLEIQKLPRNIARSYNFVSNEVIRELGENPRILVNNIIQKSGNIVISESVVDSMDFFWISKGPLGYPDTVKRLFEDFQTETTYEVKAPLINQLDSDLNKLLSDHNPPYKYVNNIDIACNWANDRCNVSVHLCKSLNDTSWKGYSFAIDATIIELKNCTSWKKIFSENGYFNKETIKLSGIKPVLYEIYDLSLDQAVTYLNKMLSQIKGDVSIFGFSIKGSSVVYAIPLLFMALTFYLFALLKEIISKYDLTQYVDTPLFYGTHPGVFLKWISCFIFPLTACIVLLVRFFNIRSFSSICGLFFTIGTILFVVLTAIESCRMPSKKNK